MGALPIVPSDEPARGGRALPDTLPARMVNEFVYCPRLFFLEWVDGVFRESADTVEGRIQHRRVDKEGGALPQPDELGEEKIHSRSVMLASERYGVIAKMDLIEAENGIVTPVDYKHGRPRETEEGLELWPADRAQLAVQGLILRENGYRCEEGVVYYQTTRQRARVSFDDEVMEETLRQIEGAWGLARSGVMPPPLEDSPKCPGCSLAGICLPDETNLLREQTWDGNGEQLGLFDVDNPPRKPAQREVRRLVAPRDDGRPLYLNTQGLRVGKSGSVLQVKDKDKVIQEARIGETCQVTVMGNVQVSTQATQALCEAGVPVCYFSMGGWFYGITTGMNTKNVFLRKAQFRLAEENWFAMRLARELIGGKIRNQRTMLQRNHIEPPEGVLAEMKRTAGQAERARDADVLLGLEGMGARMYFGQFRGMIKTEEAEAGGFSFDFERRNRRPPRDAVNAMLSLAYSLLVKDFTIACYAVGFDPYVGFLHVPRFGRPALALDLMEPFRPLIADSAVLSAINTGMVTERDFVKAGGSVALTPGGRKGLFRAYELRMDGLVTHPLFDYRVTYRRLLEIQARLLGRVLEGELDRYPVFVTR